MADVKWIKITTDMFDNRKIKYLRKLPDGDSVVLIWVMLLTMAGRCNANGMIFLTENIPYTPKMLADELDFEENTVRMALNELANMNMIVTDGTFFSIAGWDKYQNIDRLQEIREYNRLAQQKSREKKKLLQNVNDMSMTSQSCHETDIDKDIDKEKNILSKDNIRSTPTEMQQVIDSWNDLGLSKVTKIVEGTDRYKWLQKRIKDYGLAAVLQAIDNVRNSSFLQNANFFSFDWLIRPNNFPKVLDGNYNEKNTTVKNKETNSTYPDDTWSDEMKRKWDMAQ